MVTTATLNPDGHSFTMARGTWSAVYPLSELVPWIKFYRRQADMLLGQSAYLDDVRALEQLARHLGITC